MATKTILRREDVEVRENFSIPVELYLVENSEEQADSQFEIYIDGVFWCTTKTRTHATVLFTMFADHVTEYMNYEPVR